MVPKLECNKCGCEFENAVTVGYCNDCLEAYRAMRQARRDRQDLATFLAGASHIAGKWGDAKDCPRSAFDEITQKQVCGLCGCDQVEPGYGYAGGFGLGSYLICLECYEVQDFTEDLE